MSSIWQSFIPYHIAQQLVSHPDIPPTSQAQRLTAVALFADVSGFTTISEALGAEGKSGSEELTTILNSYFQPMIDLIRSYGGIIAKFGGDAMTVFFPYTEADFTQIVSRAVQCALDMQTKMADYQAIQTQSGTFSLAMKAGLAAGPLFCTTVGHPVLRLESIIAGKVLDHSAEAEHQAQAGEVVGQEALFTAANCLQGKPRTDGYYLVTAVTCPVTPAPLQPIAELTPTAVATISAFMHPVIAQRIRTGQASFINEHRKATILFVSFPGFDYDADPDVGQKLQTYLYRVIQIVERYGGYLNKVDMGDKGSKYIILFGVPIAHEDDEDRALRCALDIQALPDIDPRIGVNTGFVYSGQVGSQIRQEYTVMGDAVNLAARLMQAAQWGQTLVNETTQEAVGNAFNWQPMQTLQVKGKSQFINLYPLLGLSRADALHLQESAYALPMVGRESELQTITKALAQTLQEQGQIVGITAQAGMGKSRLAAEVIRLATAQGLAGYGGECLSHGVKTNYLVWHNLLRGFFGLDPAWLMEEQVKHLADQLAAIDPALVPRLPLLGRALNLPLPDNDLTRSMDAKLRKTSREALIVDCIQSVAATTPLLLVFEDCHWIDSLSNDLLEAVGRNIANVPVLMLVIYRPPETDRIQPYITRLGHFHEVRLTEFTRAEAEKLIGLKLIQFFGELGSIPAEFVERITERAQGNPFYIDEMINLIRDRGVNPSDVNALQGLDLPDSLHSLIISRLDQLAEITKTTLKVASVIGRLFKAHWLWDVYPQLGAPDRVKEQLTLLTKLDITPVDTHESEEIAYLFKHILTREVAYESLAVATRQMLHEQIGMYIERSFANELEQYVDLLAYHYGLSPNMEKQKKYFRLAGQAAQAAYANEAAVEYYQQLLPLLLEAEQGEVLLELGTVWQLVGKWDDAQAVFDRAWAISQQHDNRQVQANCEYKKGVLFRLKGAYDDALHWLAQAQRKLEAVGDQLGLVNVLLDTGIVYWSQGDYARALSHFRRCQEIGEDLENMHVVYRAVGNMGNVYRTQGYDERALDCYDRCFQIAQTLDDRLGAGVAIGNNGGVYLDMDDYAHALESFVQYFHISLELGYRYGVEIAVGNMGEVYEKQGDYYRSLACYRFNLFVALEIGDRFGVGFALWGMAKAYIEQGRYETAVPLIHHAIQIGRILDTPYELCEYLYTQALLWTRQGNYEQARLANEEALTIAGEVNHGQIQLNARLLQPRLWRELGIMGIEEAVEALNARLTGDLDDAHRASVLYELCRLDGDGIEAETAVLYQSLYNQTPNVQYKQRYEQLTGKTLPAPPPLPALPPIVTAFSVTTAALQRQVEAFIQEFAS